MLIKYLSYVDNLPKADSEVRFVVLYGRHQCPVSHNISGDNSPTSIEFSSD